MAAENFHIHRCGLYSHNHMFNVGEYYSFNLFTHPFYYIQNTINQQDVRDKVKCLLFLHTLYFKYEEISCQFDKGGFYSLPKGYLLLLGSLIWRKRYYEANNNTDPICYKEGRINFMFPNEYDSLLLNLDNEWRIGIKLGNGKHANYKKYTDIVQFNDPVIENKLVSLFENYVSYEFQEIKKAVELKKIDSNNKTRLLTAVDMQNLYNTLYNGCNTIGEATELVMDTSQTINGLDFKITNFAGNYELIFPYKGALEGYFTDDNNINQYYEDLYDADNYGSLVVHIPSINANQQDLTKQAVISYFQGFADMLKQCNKLNVQQQEINQSIETDEPDVKDFKCEIYYTLKNIWDRWLCTYYHDTKKTNTASSGLDIFKVQNFFDNNFMFIDSFYNNIYDVLRLNCSSVYNEYMNKENNQTHLGVSTVAHLGNVASNHMCMLFNFPDNVNFAETDKYGNKKSVDMVKNMKQVFTPLAANKIGEPEYSNKFTVIYTHSANKLDTVDRLNFVHDSFDIWSYDQGTGVAPTIFQNNPEDDAQATEALTANSRMAYKVPAFGVAYSRQDNSFWKNINISMDNFAVTEQAILAESYIANKGNSEKHNITFYGQDIYSLYQAYSYLVTVEMMGDAQIQPLMYFQLMNVPMFRGTYMIIKVEHKITPGNMTTTFTGMKMSKVQVPYASNWYTKPVKEKVAPITPNMDESQNGGGNLNAIDKTGSPTQINIADGDLARAINNNLSKTLYCDDFVVGVYNDVQKYKKCKTRNLVSGNLISDNSTGEDNSVSMLEILKTNKNNWSVITFSPSITNQKFVNMTTNNPRPVVGDLLFGYHNGRVSGVPDHVAIYLGMHYGAIYVAEGVDRIENTVYNQTNKVQVIAIQKSRLSLASDNIVYFANCKALNVKQTSESSNYGRSNETQTSYSFNDNNSSNPPVYVDDTDIKPFKFGEGQFGLIKNEESIKVFTHPDNDGVIDVVNGTNVTQNEVKTNLTILVNKVLKPIVREIDANSKDIYGTSNKPGKFKATSGYRCWKYNSSLPGASSSSEHMVGKACDFRIDGGNQAQARFNIAKTIVNWVINNGFVFDQFILYPNVKLTGRDENDTSIYNKLHNINLLHISYKGGSSRRQVLFRTESGYLTLEIINENDLARIKRIFQI